MSAPSPVIVASELTKRFPGVLAVDHLIEDQRSHIARILGA